ncbi:MAG: META domain-containing protein, partial [Campylobacteraceae bacterium]|nr:META domain-containing protein [Campylobacteraceae bacterium]
MKKAIFASFLGLFFVGCALFPNADIFKDSSWTLSSISNESLTLEKMPSLTFSKERAAGFNGVNNFSANYKLSNGKIIFSDMLSTRMAALSPKLAKLEEDFTNILLNANSFELNGDLLVIKGGG